MVYARTKLTISDDLLRPSNVVNLHYAGDNPERLYKTIPNLLRTFFRVSTHSMQEKKFDWHKGETEKFSMTWEVDKDLDRFSYLWIEVKLDGHVSKSKGEADVSIEGAIRTEYPQDTIWEKSLFYEMLRMLWHSTFYHGKRAEYVKEARRMMSNFIRGFKATAGI